MSLSLCALTKDRGQGGVEGEGGPGTDCIKRRREQMLLETAPSSDVQGHILEFREGICVSSVVSD